MKKLLSLLVALMMLTLPVLSLAEETGDGVDLGVIGGADGPTSIFTSEVNVPGNFTQNAIDAGRRVNVDMAITELTGFETGDENTDTIIKDLLDSIGVKVAQQGEETDMALTMSGTDILTLGVAASGSDAYVKSNLLGGTVVINAEEVEPLIVRLVDMFVLMGELTEEDAENIKSQIGPMMDSLIAEFDNAMAAVLQPADLLNMDFSALMEAAAPIADRIEKLEEYVVPRSCDPVSAAYMLTVTEDDALALAKAFVEFLNDNPKLKDYITYEGGYAASEEEIAQEWEYYKDTGIFESEEEFRTYYVTIDQAMEEALASMESNRDDVNEEITVMCCLGEDNLPVYVTMTVPMHVETSAVYTVSTIHVDESGAVQSETNEESATEETEADVIVNMAYIRQTVAEGTSHTVTVTSDEDVVLSGDVLVYGDHFVANATIIPDEENTITLTLDGTFQMSDAAYKADMKLDMSMAYEPVETEAMSIGGMTLPGMQNYTPKAYTDEMSVAMNVDYVLNGVDFTGTETISYTMNGAGMTIVANSATTDPEPSIMSGEVVRPAELDDAAFANWFVSVVNGFQNWTNTVLMALPESVLYLMMNTGM